MSYPLTVIQPTDLVRDSRTDLNNNFYTLYTLVTSTSAAVEQGGSTNILVFQPGHGLNVGEVIRLSEPYVYVKAQANNPQNAEAVGIVRTVNSPSEFIFTQNGGMTAGVPNVSAGTVLFLSSTVAGLLTAVEPDQAGYVSKPMAIVLESGVSMEVLSMRGIIVGGNTINSQATINNANNPYYITATDYFIDIDASAEPVTAILPTALNSGGKQYYIKKVDSSSNEVVLLPSGSQSIEGELTYIINTPGTSISVHSNNFEWLISSKYTN